MKNETQSVAGDVKQSVKRPRKKAAAAMAVGLALSPVAAPVVDGFSQTPQIESPSRARKVPGKVRVRRVIPGNVGDAHKLAMLREHIKKLQKSVPSAFLVPNVAQSRYLEHLRVRPFPKDMVFMGGNGTGKTVVGAKIVAGFVWGGRVMVGDSIHEDYAGEKEFEAWTAFREKAKTENRMISGRIVATAASLKGNGAMMQRIRRYWPKGCWKGEKLGMSYVSEFWCWDSPNDFGDKDKAIAVIDVKTVEQEPLAHAGPDMDFIWFDEPSTKDVYAENVGRCRGNADAIRIHTLTPLELAGWLIDDVVNAADGVNTVVVYGSLWENCKDWHPDGKYWSGGEVGKGRVLTRGTLEKAAIDDMVDTWRRQSPATLEARLNGKPTHLMGAVYKFYSPAVHCHEGINLPADWEEWPIWNVIDPHHVRAPAVTWWWRGPVQDILIGEWPNEDYTKMSAVLKTIQDYADKIQELEYDCGIADRVKFRFADPNSMRFTYATQGKDSDQGQTLQALYQNAGLCYDLAPDNLSSGHEAVSAAMSYDTDSPIGPGNLPKLLFMSKNLVCGGCAMVNVPNSMSRYAIKAKPLESNKSPINLKTIVSETYKDFADNTRYFITASESYPREKVSEMKSTFDAIMESRQRIPLLARSRKWR
jgi:phage terminase large subunit-like protein